MASIEGAATATDEQRARAASRLLLLISEASAQQQSAEPLEPADFTLHYDDQGVPIEPEGLTAEIIAQLLGADPDVPPNAVEPESSVPLQETPPVAKPTEASTFEPTTAFTTDTQANEPPPEPEGLFDTEEGLSFFDEFFMSRSAAEAPTATEPHAPETPAATAFAAATAEQASPIVAPKGRLRSMLTRAAKHTTPAVIERASHARLAFNKAMVGSQDWPNRDTVMEGARQAAGPYRQAKMRAPQREQAPTRDNSERSLHAAPAAGFNSDPWVRSDFAPAASNVEGRSQTSVAQEYSRDAQRNFVNERPAAQHEIDLDGMGFG